MKIGIDARVFANKSYTGVSRCAYEIIKVWAKDHPDNEYYLMCGKEIFLDLRLPSNWHIVNTPWIIDSSKLWNIFQLPKLIKQLNLDCYWGPNFTLPKKVKNVRYYVTIHDLALFKFKGIGDTSNYIKLKLFAKKACINANKIIAVSKATKRDIVEIFKIPEDKIVVSYNGGLPSGFETLKKKIDIQKIVKGNYFLFVSTIEPRKNLNTLIEAFNEFSRKSNEEYKLVLVGKKGWKCEKIYSAIENSPYKERIILPGYVSEEEKGMLFKNAKGFVFPSLYEGFGIPILEAMEYGIPVITAFNSSLPEVGGDAAIYIKDTYGINELCCKMDEVAHMSEEKKLYYSEKMKIQCKKFSWIRNAHEIMQVLEGKM